MLVSEVYINKTRGYRFGEQEPYEPYTEQIGELFRAYQKEYGRCVSKVFIDKVVDGKNVVIHVGWVFEKRMKYEDARDDDNRDEKFYVREVWVTLHERPTEIQKVEHFKEMGILS